MKIFLWIAILLCFYLPVLSQQHDENMSFATMRGKEDTTTIREFLKLAKDFETADPDSAVQYYQKATALALRLKNRSLLTTCMAQHISFLNDEAKFEDALSLAQHNLTIAKRLKIPSVLMLTCNQVGNEYEYLGDYQSATEYYLESLKLATSIGDERMQRKLNNNLASVFLGLQDYSTGYRYASTAYQMAKEVKDTVTMANCLVNMGIAELHEKKYDRALQDFDEAEKTGYGIPDMTLVADALSDKGLVYLTIHKLDAAAASYQNQKAIADKYDLPYEKMYALFQLAMVAKEKGNWNRADRYASEAVTIGEKVGTASELMEMYDSMAVIKENKGDYHSALYFKDKYEIINDSLRNEQVQTNIHHLNIQYRSAQKDKQIAEQNLSIERNEAAIERKNIWIFVSLGGILALMVILMLSLRSYRHKQNLHRQQLLTLQKQYEVDTLKAKMQAREEERNRISREMHDDIGSALTTILYLSDDLKTQDKETAASSADRIATTASSVVDKMNEIIWSMNPDYDTLGDLIAYTRRHCAEFLRDHNLQYHLEIPETITDLHLSGEQRRNIYLVIKEALHNIVKHASATEVDLCFQINQQNLGITIHDNGTGLIKNSRFGNGLKNMRHRMETIGGAFEILNGPGTTVKLNCPLNPQAADI